MSHFLYFSENRNRPVASAEQIAEIGLLHAGKQAYHGACDKGPSGGQGWLLTNGAVKTYDAATQRWKRRKDGLWVGVVKHSLPTPESLQRTEMLPGSKVRLAGADWQTPTIYAYDAEATRIPELPRLLDTDDEGRVVAGEVCEKYRWLIEAVDPFFELWSEQRSIAIAEGKDKWFFNFDRDDIAKWAVAVLSANYRIGFAEEAVLLQLFTTDYGPYEVLYAACDCGFAEYVMNKKKAATDTESLLTAAG